MLVKSVISLIDDDVGIRESLQSLLLSLGYNVYTFASAEAFLTSQQLHQTACVISDVHMPGLTELQILLQAEGFQIPVILITGHPDEHTRDRAIRAGAQAHSRGGFDPQRQPRPERELVLGADVGDWH